MTSKIKYQCSNCGSDNVQRDALAEWDTDTQQFLVHSVQDNWICSNPDCDSLSYWTEIETIDETLNDRLVKLISEFSALQYDYYICAAIGGVEDLELSVGGIDVSQLIIDGYKSKDSAYYTYLAGILIKNKLELSDD